MKEFEYYRLLLERLENQSPLDGPKEYEMMKAQAERIKNGMVMWLIDDSLRAISEQNVLKMKCSMHLMRALALSVSEGHLNSSTWNMLMMALIKTLEELYQFFIQYTGIEVGEFELSDWESKSELVN